MIWRDGKSRAALSLTHSLQGYGQKVSTQMIGEVPRMQREASTKIGVFAGIITLCHAIYTFTVAQHTNYCSRCHRQQAPLRLHIPPTVMKTCVIFAPFSGTQAASMLLCMEWTHLKPSFGMLLKPNTHRRRDETVESRRVGGVYTNSQLVGDSFVVSSV